MSTCFLKISLQRQDCNLLHCTELQDTEDGPIRVVRHVVLPQKRDQFFLRASNNGIIVALIDAWLHKTLLIADANELVDFVGRIIAQSELLEFAVAICLVHGPRCVQQRRLSVGHMQVHGVYRRGLQSLQTFCDARLDLFRGKGSRFHALDFGVDGELPDRTDLSKAIFGHAIVPGCVDMGTTMGDEEIEDLLNVLKIIKMYNLWPGNFVPELEGLQYVFASANRSCLTV